MCYSEPGTVCSAGDAVSPGRGLPTETRPCVQGKPRASDESKKAPKK